MLYIITGIIILFYLSKLFRKIGLAKNLRELNKLDKVSEMLSEEFFWTIINQSLKNSRAQIEQEKRLVSIIEKLTLKEIIGFRLRTDKFLHDTYNSKMWCAASIMNGGCSDDGFEYFRCWVISKGKNVYTKAKENPDSLINVSTYDLGFYEFENFWYVALKVFTSKTGKNLYDYIDYDKFLTREGKYPRFDFTWSEKDSESMRKICPKLFAKFKQ